MGNLSVRELEAQVLEGKEIDPAALIQAQQRADASRRISELNRQRAERLAHEAAIEARQQVLLTLQEDFERLRSSDAETVKELWLNIAKSIKAYATAVQARNAELREIANTLRNEKQRPTEGLVPPYRFAADDRGCSIDKNDLHIIDPALEIDRCVGLAMGEFAPNHPGYLGHGGGSAAKEAGI